MLTTLSGLVDRLVVVMVCWAASTTLMFLMMCDVVAVPNWLMLLFIVAYLIQAAATDRVWKQTHCILRSADGRLHDCGDHPDRPRSLDNSR